MSTHPIYTERNATKLRALVVAEWHNQYDRWSLIASPRIAGDFYDYARNNFPQPPAPELKLKRVELLDDLYATYYTGSDSDYPMYHVSGKGSHGLAAVLWSFSAHGSEHITAAELLALPAAPYAEAESAEDFSPNSEQCFELREIITRDGVHAMVKRYEAMKREAGE